MSQTSEDIELASASTKPSKPPSTKCCPNSTRLQNEGCEDKVQRNWRKSFLSFAPSVIRWASDYIHRSKTCEHEVPQSKSDQLLRALRERLLNLSIVEDFRPGYPRYSALIGSNDSFQICRRFSILRTRLLLEKQDRLSLLEKELERLDKEEIAPLFLGSIRFDRNIERLQVLSDIDTALADYGTLLNPFLMSQSNNMYVLKMRW